MSGYFVGLSGGIDSGSCALLVYCMCRLLAKEVRDANARIIDELGRITGATAIPDNAHELCRYSART